MKRTAQSWTAGTVVALVAAAGATALAASPAAADSADTATVSVFHGVPGATVDVYANDERLIDDFEPGTLADPLQLPAGTYKIAILPGDAADGTVDPLIGPADIPVESGGNYTIVAHLGADGAPPRRCSQTTRAVRRPARAA